MSFSLFTSSVVGYVYMPVIDPRIETHVDVQSAIALREGPAATEVPAIEPDAAPSATEPAAEPIIGIAGEGI